MRAVGEELTANTKQPVILENRPGGGAQFTIAVPAAIQPSVPADQRG